MRKFSFWRRILFKHTDLTPQWCEVHNPLHGKLHAAQGQTLFRVRPALKVPIGALKGGHWAPKMAHCALKMAHCALKMAHWRLTNVLLCPHWTAKIAH